MQAIKAAIENAADMQSAYLALVQGGLITADPAQAEMAEGLQILYQQLEERVNLPASWAGFFGLKRDAIPDVCGAYLWGDVGRGKTMLMEIFFDKAPLAKKRRIHFHAFMREIHGRIHSWRQLKPKDDLLKRVVDEIARETDLLCLDEMQVHDITDAAILSRLFTLLFMRGVTVVFTSNRPPKDLYQGGIQREQFVPFIELIERHMHVLKLKSATDYRLKQLQAMERTYFTPDNAASTEQLYHIYESLTQNHSSTPLRLMVNGRRIEIAKNACGVAWLTFAELCERPLGAADYLEIAMVFHTLILQSIPQMSWEKRNEAKRFVTLIDALYEHKVKFICSAAAEPDALYINGDGSFEFVRTASRLHEMQSARYLAMEHML